MVLEPIRPLSVRAFLRAFQHTLEYSIRYFRNLRRQCDASSGTITLIANVRYRWENRRVLIKKTDYGTALWFASVRLQSGVIGGHSGAKLETRKKVPPNPMPLSDIQIRSAKPSEKPKKLGDSAGLFLLVQPSGGKLWRFKHRIDGKEKKLSLGRYPYVTLQEARKRRDEARSNLARGTDPAEEKKQAELEAQNRNANSFERVGEEYLAKIAAEGREAVTIKKSRWLLSLLTPTIGSIPVSDIKPAQLLAAITLFTTRGTTKPLAE
ncbi:MAG: Arm DNA-binding domain-containing protein [Erythrobacter sp.]